MLKSLLLQKPPNLPCSYQRESLAPLWSLNTADTVHAAPGSNDRKEPVKKTRHQDFNEAWILVVSKLWWNCLKNTQSSP